MVSQNFIDVSTLTIATNNYRLIIGVFVLIGIAIAIIGCYCCCYKNNGCNYNSSFGGPIGIGTFGGFSRGGPIGGGPGDSCEGPGPSCD